MRPMIDQKLTKESIGATQWHGTIVHNAAIPDARDNNLRAQNLHRIASDPIRVIGCERISESDALQLAMIADANVDFYYWSACKPLAGVRSRLDEFFERIHIV